MLRRRGDFGRTIAVGGVNFVVTRFDEAVDGAIALARRPVAMPLRFSNAYSVAIANSDLRYRAVLNAPGITFPDGVPIARVMRSLARRHGIDPRDVELVRGPSFFAAVLERSAGTGVRHFFLGASTATITALVEGVHELDSGIVVAGAHAPDVGPVDDEFVRAMAERVRASGANLLWVALGTPKQDYAAGRLAAELHIPVAAVGAAFDFVAGTVREAPKLLQGHGMEWLFRLSQDPRRLWRRYAVGNARFVLVSLRTLLGRSR